MSTINDLVGRLEKVKVEELTNESLEETKDTLIDLNQQQLTEGIRSDGEKIHWLKDTHYPYTKPYARSKAKKGYQTSVVDLNASPDKRFYQSEGIKIEKGELQFSSSIKLSEYLESNYGVKIWGVTDDNKKTYTIGTFFTAFKNRIESVTGLKFH